MTVFDYVGQLLAAINSDPISQVLVAARGRETLAAVAEFHLWRGACRADRLAAELEREGFDVRR